MRDRLKATGKAIMDVSVMCASEPDIQIVQPVSGGLRAPKRDECKTWKPRDESEESLSMNEMDLFGDFAKEGDLRLYVVFCQVSEMT